MQKFDLIVIGGGPGGYLAAELAGKAGINCLLIEKHAVGGVCLNEGCIPTKSLLYAAKIYDFEKRQGNKHGIHCENPVFNQAKVVEHKNETVKTLVGGVEGMLKRSKVKVVKQEAQITGRNGSEYSIKAGEETYVARKLILASGSSPVVPKIAGLEQEMEKGSVLTNRGILDIEEIPPNLVVIGGGVVGLEMAAYFCAAGSKVSVIEMLDKIGGALDAEISELLQKELEMQGVVFHLESQVVKVDNGRVTFKHGDNEATISYDKMLLSVGRRANLVQGLVNIGVETMNGCISIDEKCLTNVSGVYAVGDVTGKLMLAHMAYRQAEVAVSDILGNEDSVDYTAVPSVIYTNPEVAWVGVNEQQAKEQGFRYTVHKASVNTSGRHVAEHGITSGICKLLVDTNKGIILGGGMIGGYASEIIYALVLMVQNRIPIGSIRKTIFPHPTVCEVIKEALR